MYNNVNLHYCRTLICTLKYANIFELGGLAKLNMSKASLTEKRCLVIVIDLCNHYKSRFVSYLNFRSNKYKVNDNHKPHNKYSEFVPIKFVSKKLEDIDFNGILNDSEAMKYFPSKHLSKKFNNEELRFSTCYKYEQSIRCDIINYKCNIMDNGPIDDVTYFCHLYPDFINCSVGHVVTGDVSIVKKRNLETYLRKDTSLLNLSIRINIVYFKTSSKISVVILKIFH